VKGLSIHRQGILIAGAVVYALLLFILMTLWRLPADRWLGYLAERITGGRIVFRAARAAPAFPLGYRLEQISYSVAHGGIPIMARLKGLTVKADPLSLLAANISVTFSADLPSGGSIRGKVGVSAFSGLERGSFTMKVMSASLEEMGIGAFLERSVKGTVNGELSMKGRITEPSGLTGQGLFVFQNASVDTLMDLAGLKAITFERVRLPFSVREGLVSIEKAEIEGPTFSGTVAGQVRMNKPLDNSALELTARLKPGAALENNPTVSPLLARIRKGTDPVVLNLRGVIAKPSMTWGGN
jgi:type II secretion system protein N